LIGAEILDIERVAALLLTARYAIRRISRYDSPIIITSFASLCQLYAEIMNSQGFYAKIMRKRAGLFPDWLKFWHLMTCGRW